MYCPNCGADNLEGVKFCKRCGASINLPAARPCVEIAPGKMTGMFWSIAVLALGGLALILGCMAALIALGLDKDLLAVVTVLGFVTVFGVAGLLIRQLSRLINFVESNPVQVAHASTLADYAPPQVTGQPGPVSSVTEHTTRNFDRIYEQQRTRE